MNEQELQELESLCRGAPDFLWEADNLIRETYVALNTAIPRLIAMVREAQYKNGELKRMIEGGRRFVETAIGEWDQDHG